MKLLNDSSFTKYRPALLSLLVWLFEKGEKHNLALDVLEKYTVSRAFDELYQVADFKMKLGRYSEAKIDLEKIFTEFPDRKTIKLESLYLYCVSHLGRQYSKDMKSLTEILEYGCSIELDSNFENLQMLPGMTKTINEEKKKKKKRPKRLPKNYDAERIPDSGMWYWSMIDDVHEIERWIPKRMRKGTLASKKGKGKGKEIAHETSGFGFQGVALQGGGIGSTGSARIAGFKVPPSSNVVVESKEEPEKMVKKFPSVKKLKGKKKK